MGTDFNNKYGLIVIFILVKQRLLQSAKTTLLLRGSRRKTCITF
jgi:hypothetical protein